MSQNNIYPKICGYGCGLRIYWNTAVSEYWGVLTQKKHICPNSRKPNTNTSNTTTSGNSYNYSKKPWTPKQKMSNSFELLQGSITAVQKQYEVFFIFVYYEVPEGKRDDVKSKFEFIRNKTSASNNAASTYIPSGSSVAA